MQIVHGIDQRSELIRGSRIGACDIGSVTAKLRAGIGPVGRWPELPAGWADVRRKLGTSVMAEVREKALLLSVLFGDKEAVTALRAVVDDAKAAEAARRNALHVHDAAVVRFSASMVNDG